jgi:molybdopterin-binding protein
MYSPGYSVKRAVGERETSTTRISARNRPEGRVVEVARGHITAHVRIDVGGIIVTASVTNEAVDEFGLKPRDQAYAVVKASDVMVATDG